MNDLAPLALFSLFALFWFLQGIKPEEIGFLRFYLKWRK
jgi:hypothetical protein